ncbi:MAG: hypothetical protein RQ936_07475 [Gammaproteobacteria bacterium]|nr:hypothetical protein [Gammaproteobacteria bacterium]
MNVSTAQLASAREVANELFEILGLRAYLFEVEPQDGEWLIQVECAVDEGWMSTNLYVDSDLLIQSKDKQAVRDQLLQKWGEQLTSCQRNR